MQIATPEFEAEENIVAHHEAGHAVMAMACGFRLTQLCLLPTESNLGFVSYEVPEEIEGESARKCALVSAAGLAADLLLAKNTGKPRKDGNFWGHFNDQVACAKYIALSGMPGSFESYLVVAGAFLKENWKAVEKLAEMLKTFPELRPQALNLDFFPKLPSDWQRILEIACVRMNSEDGSL